MVAFCLTSVSDNGRRVVDFPVGSPIRAVKSPIINNTWCPMFWSFASCFNITACPKCRSGADGSAPHLMVNFFGPLTNSSRVS